MDNNSLIEVFSYITITLIMVISLIFVLFKGRVLKFFTKKIKHLKNEPIDWNLDYFRIYQQATVSISSQIKNYISLELSTDQADFQFNVWLKAKINEELNTNHKLTRKEHDFIKLALHKYFKITD